MNNVVLSEAEHLDLVPNLCRRALSRRMNNVMLSEAKHLDLP